MRAAYDPNPIWLRLDWMLAHMPPDWPPTVETAVITAPRIIESMTAYSTEVGPSSSLRN